MFQNLYSSVSWRSWVFAICNVVTYWIIITVFESISLDNIHEIFAILKDKDIIIEDPLNLNGIFTQYQNLSELEKYFDNNMSK